MANPYKVLGVHPSASLDDVTQAYRRLAKKYHPDLNPGNAAAENKMREINAAYEQIKADIENGGPENYAQSESARGDGQNTAGGGARQQSFGKFAQVRQCLLAAQYPHALHLLGTISQRNAEWYYLSAMANAGVGGRVTALAHAREAARLEPNNPEYQSLLRRYEQGVYRYQRTGRDYGYTMRRAGMTLLGIALANFFCFICCRPC